MMMGQAQVRGRRRGVSPLLPQFPVPFSSAASPTNVPRQPLTPAVEKACHPLCCGWSAFFSEDLSFAGYLCFHLHSTLASMLRSCLPHLPSPPSFFLSFFFSSQFQLERWQLQQAHIFMFITTSGPLILPSKGLRAGRRDPASRPGPPWTGVWVWTVRQVLALPQGLCDWMVLLESVIWGMPSLPSRSSRDQWHKRM